MGPPGPVTGIPLPITLTSLHIQVSNRQKVVTGNITVTSLSLKKKAVTYLFRIRCRCQLQTSAARSAIRKPKGCVPTKISVPKHNGNYMYNSVIWKSCPFCLRSVFMSTGYLRCFFVNISRTHTASLPATAFVWTRTARRTSHVTVRSLSLLDNQ
jgi:hypothetical protein